MGDRLVIQVRKNKKFLAALYSHWAASDGDLLFDRLWEKVEKIDNKADFEDLQICTVRAIYNTLAEYNSIFVTPGILIRSDIMDKPYISKESKIFLSNHSEFPESTNHNAFITVDEKIWYLWDSIAESTYDIDIGGECFIDYSAEIMERLEIWRNNFENKRNAYLNI